MLLCSIPLPHDSCRTPQLKIIRVSPQISPDPLCVLKEDKEKNGLVLEERKGMMQDQWEKGKRKEMMQEGRNMSLSILICPMREESVMKIIRPGSIIPPLTFPSDFPDSPIGNACISTARWRNLRFLQESTEWRPRALVFCCWQCHTSLSGQFILLSHTNLLPFPFYCYFHKNKCIYIF